MNNRDRIINCLTFQPIDHVPFGVGIGFCPWQETLDRWRAESGIANLDPAAYFGYEMGFLVAPAEYGLFPGFEPKTLSEDDTYITSIEARGIVTRRLKGNSGMAEFLSHPVKTPHDWQHYKEERLQPRLDERLANLDSFLAWARNFDAPIQAGCFPWGVFGTARDVMGAEGLLIGFCTEPEMVHDIMKAHTDLWLMLYERIAQKAGIDHIHIWEDMSGRQGSLISMAMVEEFMMPHYDRIKAFADAHSIPIVSVDTDGNVDQLLPVMQDHGINMMMPFEVQAGCDIERYRAMYPRLGIMGGLDKNALALTKKEINGELAKTERMLAHGGFIPSFDHHIPPNVPWENWKYAMVNLKKILGT